MYANVFWLSNPYFDAAPYFRKVQCIFLDNTYNEHKLHQHGCGCQISIVFNVLYVIQCIYYVIHVIYVLYIKIPLCRFQKRVAGYQWLPVRPQQAVHRLKHQQKIINLQFLKIYWKLICIIDRVTYDEKLIEMIEG